MPERAETFSEILLQYYRILFIYIYIYIFENLDLSIKQFTTKYNKNSCVEEINEGQNNVFKLQNLIQFFHRFDQRTF